MLRLFHGRPYGVGESVPAVVALPKRSIQIVKSDDLMDLDGDSEADAIEFTSNSHRIQRRHRVYICSVLRGIM